MRQALIVKMSSLGDIIHVFPVIDYIKENFPRMLIDWVVEQPFVELVKAHPNINSVIPIQTKRWRANWWDKSVWQEIRAFRRQLRNSFYDLLLDLQGNVKSALVTANARSSLKVGFGFSSSPEWPNAFMLHQRFNPPKGNNIREDYLFIAKSALGKFDSGPKREIQLRLNHEEQSTIKQLFEYCLSKEALKVMVCPGSNWANKQLSKESLKCFLDRFLKHQRAYFLFLWGNQEEKIFVEELAQSLPNMSTVLNKLTLPALQNVMTQMDLIIAMDSLPLHLAGTTSTPTFSIFGASLAKKYQPLGEQHKSLQGSCPYGKLFEKRCDLLRSCSTGAFIKGLDGNQIYDYFVEWWCTKKIDAVKRDTF